MSVLIIHSDPDSTQTLVNFFQERGEPTQHASTLVESRALFKQVRPTVVLFDLYLADEMWAQALGQLCQYPDVRVIVTAAYPDPARESEAKSRGADLILHQPFTRSALERALQGGRDETAPHAPPTRPRIRIPIRLKITLPYVLLALLLALAAAYVVSQVVLDTIEERFTNQLVEAGKLTSDWFVEEEDRLLETLRLLAYTQALPEAVAAGDAEALRTMALPLAVNYQEEAIEILDLSGSSILSLRHRRGGNMEDYETSRGDPIFAQWSFVQNILARQIENGRDKYAGLVDAPWGRYFYVAGPIVDDNEQVVGVVLVGKSLQTLVRQIRQDTLAQTTIYDFNGRPLVSSLPPIDGETLVLNADQTRGIVTRHGDNSLIRSISVASIDYSEILGVWQARRSIALDEAERLGLVGVSLAETFVVRPSQITRLEVFLLTAVAFILIIGLGVYVAHRITRPLLQVVHASTEIARGNLDVQVKAEGNDEVAALSHTFNEMVAGLQERSLYRDLLGRAVSPEVREQLRRSFASGDVRLEGQETTATILVCNIHGFTTLAEVEASSMVMAWLNEYFDELVPIISNYGGVVGKFEGDMMLAFFGVLPRSLPPQTSAYHACQAALALLAVIERLNQQRQQRGHPPFLAGLAINTGPVTAGALGSAERMHYTVIGDTVNTTIRLEGLTRQFGQENGIVISQHTLFALGEHRHTFYFEPLGAHTVRGKSEQLLAYRLHPTQVGLLEEGY